MSAESIIEMALDYSKKYQKNIHKLIFDLGIRIEYILSDINITAFTETVRDIHTIFINESLYGLEKEFILTHEVAHILLHDEIIRSFVNRLNNNSKQEREANIFTTVFLGCTYNDSINTNIQKIINGIYADHLIFYKKRI